VKNNGVSHALPDGLKVRILSSRHPDVIAGTTGLIDGMREGGYFIKIEGDWMIAGSDRGATRHGVESCWYPGNEFIVV